jgi:type I restriction enzyme S subunit
MSSKNWAMKSHYKKIGDYIQLVDERNTGLKVKMLLGLSISKQFIPSVANIIGTDMENYKIIRKNQFACSTMQVRRDRKMPVALLQDFDEAIISPAYPVFETADPKTLLPEYLMMWFSRSEFDREALFYAIGGVRGSLEWEDFCNMTLPIPSPGKQRELVKEYNTILQRIDLNNQLIQKLEETAQAIYKQWFVDFEFPNENGEPYKSAGGEMVESELGDVPKGWKVGKLNDIASFSKTKISIRKLTSKNYISTENMLQNRGGIVEVDELPQTNNVTKFTIDETLISNIRPYFKKIWMATFEGGCSNDVLCLIPDQKIIPEYLYYIIERDDFFDYVMAGSNGAKMPRGDKHWIMLYPIVLADENVLNHFKKVLIPILNLKNSKRQELSTLKKVTDTLLSKLATVER